MLAVALCAGSYGTQLQTNYLIKKRVVSSLAMIDDFKSPEEYVGKYSDSVTKLASSQFVTPELVIPSFALPSLSKLTGVEMPSLWQDKLNLSLLPPSVVAFTTAYSADKIQITHPMISKPRFNSSGGRGVLAHLTGEVVECTADRVFQEYLSGPEYVVDVVADTTFNYSFTIRRTLSMESGRDVKVSFDIPEYVINQAIKAIESVIGVIPTRAFNIQMKEPSEGKNPLVLEIDTRLSGSSICNIAYDKLINHLVTNKTEINYIRGEFNNECVSVYEAIGLSVPSVV